VVVATINSGGYQVSATNTMFVSVAPAHLNGITRINGGFIFTFTNSPGASFTVLSSTNVNGSPATWPCGNGHGDRSGRISIVDSNAADERRFYQVVAL